MSQFARDSLVERLVWSPIEMQQNWLAVRVRARVSRDWLLRCAMLAGARRGAVNLR